MKRTTLAAIALATLLPISALAQNGTPGLHFIENWDGDDDGQITLAEATEKRGDIFYMFDQDENELLDAEEYKLFDATREEDMQTNAGGQQNGQMRGVNQGLMQQYNDANGDGAVSKDEFLARVPEWFAMMDRNEDGVVTTADFGRRGG